jgi:F0F1-type ATP synthase membrane subunit b/b'
MSYFIIKGGENMSIIDSIQEAEKKAGEIRKQAQFQAREILRDTKINLEQDRDNHLSEVEKQFAYINIEYNKNSEKIMKTKLESAAQRDQVMAKNARKHFPQAVSFILERVKAL